MRRRRLPAVVLLLAVLAATALTAVPASAGGGGCHRPATDGRGTTVALTELCFSPTVLRVEEGSQVTIVNRDAVAHPLARPGRDWYWEGTAGDRTTVRLDQAGTYPFFCYAHPGMVGVVVVGDGQGTGSGVVEVADTGTATGSRTGAAAGGGAGETAAATTGSGPAQLPVAWLVVVALAALVGAVAGRWQPPPPADAGTAVRAVAARTARSRTTAG
ncbi:MAG TPA: plastocyanin/azurin family copper-binding protein, partial [Actinomycetota bacterium]|nr:plastocyanin/azurin family copper-binding protein [Actinomycetota bacterium]